MITTSNINLVKKEIMQAASRPIIVLGHDDAFNRKVLEYGKFDVLVDPHLGVRRDKLKKLDAGFNHVLARIAAKNNVAIGIDIGKLSKVSKHDKAVQLARIREIIAACKKAKAKLVVLTNQKKEAFHLLLTLGASTAQAKQAITF